MKNRRKDLSCQPGGIARRESQFEKLPIGGYSLSWTRGESSACSVVGVIFNDLQGWLVTSIMSTARAISVYIIHSPGYGIICGGMDVAVSLMFISHDNIFAIYLLIWTFRP
jgi:hypothetical protein